MTTAHPAGSRPLTGLRVVDFGQFIAAPGAGQNLADLGADVVKVEPPAGDQARRVGTFGMAMVRANNRAKRSLAIDLRAPGSGEIVADLIATADVLLHNFRPGVVDRLGLDAATLTTRHPRLVYGFVSGFGSRGPSAAQAGLDIAAQAEFAVMDLTGEADRDPQRVGFAVTDVLAAQALTSGVLAALLARSADGRGRVVETSLMEAVVHAQAPQWTEHGMTGRAPRRRGNGQALAAPAADLIRTRDGGALVISAYTVEKFAALCEVIGRPGLASDARFSSNSARVAHRDELLAILHATLGRLDRAGALERLRSAGIVCGAVRSFDEITTDPDLLASGLIADCRGPEGTDGRYSAPTTPFSLDGHRLSTSAPAPDTGEHTGRILAELGRDETEIRELIARGVVAGAAPGAPSELSATLTKEIA
ncbi:CaiB/BaiF CoA-transferase family protein [Streptomyces sp. NBC_01306]|uniref:CaiB/BaiF CoA transferase family protein n=1 Tax=Streptomyces sp. NBC_01306 TaxID=2903819 RepID=UPI002254BA91|nr:CaiB/BaiF CoA-transferase family protein [Streptomyces sp. NBC_01306]MCX4727666.1 CoA transferase [Streptomyces sp. NBC_01306]